MIKNTALLRFQRHLAFAIAFVIVVAFAAAIAGCGGSTAVTPNAATTTSAPMVGSSDYWLAKEAAEPGGMLHRLTVGAWNDSKVSCAAARSRGASGSDDPGCKYLASHVDPTVEIGTATSVGR